MYSSLPFDVVFPSSALSFAKVDNWKSISFCQLFSPPRKINRDVARWWEKENVARIKTAASLSMISRNDENGLSKPDVRRWENTRRRQENGNVQEIKIADQPAYLDNVDVNNARSDFLRRERERHGQRKSQWILIKTSPIIGKINVSKNEGRMFSDLN